MTHSAFAFIRQHYIDNLKLQFEEYQHIATGARHYHLASEDNNNAFLIGFLTVPQDSTGVAHILEHTTLCGSKRYPVRDPFFMMIRRSLNTFMNAFTSSDWTAYPFASQNVKDFDNLLQVYLDAVFFPNLDPLDFAQEGCRLEFETPDDPNSPLVYRGVVYNEMKGAISSSTQLLWDKLSAHLFPTITYHYNSGGDIAEIPTLTVEQLRAFHATHYHPSNAVLMTYGNLPASHHHAYFEQCALSRFDKLNINLQVPDEQRYTTPQYINTAYPLEEGDCREKTHIVMAWLLNRLTDVQAVMNAALLSGVLLDNSASPLRHALESCGLGDSPSPFCGFDESTRETFFACGLEGSDPEHADAVEKLILDVLNTVAQEGVDPAQIEAVLHQMELQQREITGDGFPYGLHLLVNMLAPSLHGGDPLLTLDIDPVLERVRQDCQDPQFIQRLVQELLLNNPHRVRLVMAPDPELAAQQLAEEQAHLAEQKARLDEAAQQQLIEQAAALKQRQTTVDDPDILPKVTRDDIPETLILPEGQTDTVAGMTTTWFAQGTNGMVYQHLVLEIPHLNKPLLGLMPIFCDCLTELGCAGETYLATAARQATFTGGINARLSVRNGIADIHQISGNFSLSGKALIRNQAMLTQLLRDTLTSVRFDELPRLRELIGQLRSSIDSSITDRGHNLAMLAACSGISPAGALFQHWYGFDSIHLVRELDDRLDDPAALSAFAEQLNQIRDLLVAAPRQCLIVSEQQHQSDIRTSLTECWQHPLPIQQPFSPLKAIPIKRRVQQAWTTNTQVAFCARAYPVVAMQHRDAPSLLVLGDFLRNGFLHRAIREQGGAYGAGANYDSDSGSFRLFSYRDPHLAETLQAFDESLIWLQTHQHGEQNLEDALFNVISRIDRPGSPAGEAISTFFANLHGRTPEHRQAFRSQILKVTIADLQRVALTYLQPEYANTVVLTDNKQLVKAGDLGLEKFTL